MSLYKDTYETIITTIATSIHDKIQNLVLDINPNKNMVFCKLTTANNTAEYAPVASKRNQKIITEEKITASRTKPTQDTIKTHIKTFIKNSLGFTDSTFNQIPTGNEMIRFIFAINFFLEKSLTNVALGLNSTTILYTPITSSSGFTNRITSNTNTINNSLVTELYNTLKNINCANNTGGKLEISGTITSSCSSSSCSSSSSSSSSSSCSSSSMFIVYFNI